MKRICVLLCLLLLCGLLFGCGGTEIPPVTEPTAPPQPENQATVPVVGENAIYFANELEARRLYQLDLDTGAAQMILDEQCYDVNQRGDMVYFISDQNLCAWDISAGQHVLVQENTASYALEGDYLLYSQHQEDYQEALYWRDLVTGEEGKLRTSHYLMLTTDRGYAYYVTRNYDSEQDMVCAYDLRNREERILYQTHSGGFLYGDMLLAMEDGVLFHVGSSERDMWLHAKRDGSVQETEWDLPEESCEPFAASNEEILYIHHKYGQDECSQIRRLTASGEETVLAQCDPGAYYWVYPLKEDLWLVEHSAYIPWGAYNEYGYQENYSYQVRYYTLQSNGTVTLVNAQGAMGSMFAAGDFPVIDSSTARKPVTAELYNIFVKNHGYVGAAPLCSTTHGAWLNIADGTVDLALLAAPTPEEQAYLDQKGVEVEMKLYGGDGLVFIGNKENPVSNITHEQLIAIYRGEITNWKELGGPDQPITVYYRDDQSGSQRLFENLVWKDGPVPDFHALGFDIEGEMSSIVHMVQEDPYSIGYTIMTYLDDVYGENALRVFSINGVEPSAQTVANGSYPYHTKGYLVIRSDEPAGSPARRLFDWFGCPVSDELLHQCGVTPLHG